MGKKDNKRSSGLTVDDIKIIVQSEIKSIPQAKTTLSQRPFVTWITVFIAFVGAGTGVWGVCNEIGNDIAKCKIIMTGYSFNDTKDNTTYASFRQKRPYY